MAVRSLLLSRADVHLCDDAQETAEMAAMASGHTEIVELLKSERSCCGAVTPKSPSP